jgi:ribosomal protein S18 acetylase RimI-like enzyme
MPPSKPSEGAPLISPLRTEADASACARLMATSEPWITLGRSYEASLDLIQDPSREVYVARDAAGLAGFLVLCLTGAFVGYIQTICIDPGRRGQGLGSRLVEFAEERILRVSPNVFLCVSSFNRDARRLYERLGYKVVGELTDYIVRGHSEVLLRKTLGPLTEFSSKGSG